MEYYDKDPTGNIPPVEPPKSDTDLEALEAVEVAGKVPDETQKAEDGSKKTDDASPEDIAEPKKQKATGTKTQKEKKAAEKEKKVDGKAEKKQKKIRWKRLLIISVASLLVLIIGFGVLIAQPWVPAPTPEEIASPEPTRLPDAIELEVGQSAPIEVPLGDNERIDAITTEDTDVISIVDGSVTAHGQWKGAIVRVRVKQIEAVQPQPKPFKVLGVDMSGLRASLRELLGIEKPFVVTEPIVTAVYEIQVNIKGYPTEYGGPVNLYTLDYHTFDLSELADGQKAEFTYDSGFVEVYERQVDGQTEYAVHSGFVTGRQLVTAVIGFEKDGKFVEMYALEYYVEVRDRPEDGETVIFTEGPYNGMVPVLEQP